VHRPKPLLMALSARKSGPGGAGLAEHIQGLKRDERECLGLVEHGAVVSVSLLLCQADAGRSTRVSNSCRSYRKMALPSWSRPDLRALNDTSAQARGFFGHSAAARTLSCIPFTVAADRGLENSPSCHLFIGEINAPRRNVNKLDRWPSPAPGSSIDRPIHCTCT
jgi:hypothetical protein